MKNDIFKYYFIAKITNWKGYSIYHIESLFITIS